MNHKLLKVVYFHCGGLRVVSNFENAALESSYLERGGFLFLFTGANHDTAWGDSARERHAHEAREREARDAASSAASETRQKYDVMFSVGFEFSCKYNSHYECGSWYFCCTGNWNEN